MANATTYLKLIYFIIIIFFFQTSKSEIERQVKKPVQRAPM